MKKLFLALSLFALPFMGVQAQRIAFVDVTAIMETIPDYQKNQQELDRIAEQWKQEIQRDYNAIEDMYRKYQAEEVLLSESAKKERQEAITEREKLVRDKQKNRFGPDGELAKKRQALVKPIQERVYNTIQSYAEEKGYDFIFDKANAGMLFASPTYDKTEDIIKRLK